VGLLLDNCVYSELIELKFLSLQILDARTKMSIKDRLFLHVIYQEKENIKLKVN